MDDPNDQIREDRKLESKPLVAKGAKVGANPTDFSNYKKQPLNRQQINKALMDIEDTNPLKDAV